MSPLNMTFAVSDSIETTETHFAVLNIGTVKNLKLHVHSNDTTSFSYDDLTIDFASEDSVLFFNNGTAETPVFKNNLGQDVSIGSASFINLKPMSASIFNNGLSSTSDKIIGSIGAHIVHSAYSGMSEPQIKNINFSQSNGGLISGWDDTKRTVLNNEVQSLIQERIDASGDASEKTFWQDKVFGGVDLSGQSAEYAFGFNEVIWMLIESPFLMESLHSSNHNAFASNTRVQDSTRFLVGLVNNPIFSPSNKTELQTAVDSWIIDEIASNNVRGNISGWNVSNVTDMSELFMGTDVSGRVINLSSWDMSNVKKADDMFRNIPNLGSGSFRADGWDLSECTDVHSMFVGSFTGSSTVTPSLQNWTIGKSVDGVITGAIAYSMFEGCTQFNGNIAGWTVYTSGTVNHQMFLNCNAFQGDGLSTSTFHLTGNCHSFFEFCENLGESTEINLSSWNMNGVTDANQFFRATFKLGQSGFTADDWDLSNCASIKEMFNGSFRGTLTVTPSLQNWTLGSSTVLASAESVFLDSYFNGNIASWNTLNVNIMRQMFKGANNFDHNIGSWNISKVNDMSNMLNDSGLSATNYSNTLVGWSTQSVQTGVSLGATGLYYNGTGEAARDILTNSSNNWNITDDGGLYKVRITESPNQDTNYIIFSNVTLSSNDNTINLENASAANIYNSNALPERGIDGDTSTLYHSTNDENSYWMAEFNPNDYTSFTISVTGQNNNNTVGQLVNVEILSPDSSVLYTSDDLRIGYAFNDANNTFEQPYTDYFHFTIDSFSPSNNAELQTAVDSWYSDETNATINYGNINTWDVRNVEDMSELFKDKTNFNSNISNWDTSNVTTLVEMFNNANQFNQNIGGWNVSNVKDTSRMFLTAHADWSTAIPNQFNQNIGGWDVSKVKDMAEMFNGANQFNQNIGGWNVSNVTDINRMFRTTHADFLAERPNQFNQNIGGWDVSKVKDMTSLFSDGLFDQNIGGWNVSNVTDMTQMLKGSSFNHNIGGWNVSNVTTMSTTFKNASSFNHNIGSWNISKVNNMSNMLSNSGLSAINYSNTLVGWSSQSVRTGVGLGATGLYYNGTGALARDYLIDNFSWGIGGTLIDESPVVSYSKYSDNAVNTGSSTVTDNITAVYDNGDFIFTENTLSISSPFTTSDTQMTISFWFTGVHAAGANFHHPLFKIINGNSYINIGTRGGGHAPNSAYLETQITTDRGAATLETDHEISIYINGVLASNSFGTSPNNWGTRTHDSISLPYTTNKLDNANYHFVFVIDFKSDLNALGDISFGEGYLAGSLNHPRIHDNAIFTDINVFNRLLTEKECVYLYEKGRRPAKIFSRNVSPTIFNGTGDTHNDSLGTVLSSETDLFASDEEKVALSSILGSSSKTIEAYVSIGNEKPQFCVNLGTLSNNQFFGLYVNNYQLGFSGNSNDYFDTNIYLVKDVVYRIAASYEESNNTVTVLCQSIETGIVETASKVLAVLNTNGNELSIGGNNNLANHKWNGYIGEVNVYNIAISSFDDLNSEYPPSAMSANSTYIDEYGQFVASESSFFDFGDGNSYSAYQLFNHDLSDIGWHSTNDAYNDANGSYNGSDSLGGYDGEWISLKMLSPITINAVRIAPRVDTITRCPKSFVILGSNDNGSSWDIIYNFADIHEDQYSNNTLTTFEFPVSALYEQFAMVILEIFGNGTSSTVPVNFAELRFLNIPPVSGVTPIARLRLSSESTTLPYPALFNNSSINMTPVENNGNWVSYKIIEVSETSSDTFKLTFDSSSIGRFTQGISVSNSVVRDYLTWNPGNIYIGNPATSDEEINLFETNREMIIRFNGNRTVTFNIYNSSSTTPITITMEGSSIYYYILIDNNFAAHNVDISRISFSGHTTKYPEINLTSNIQDGYTVTESSYESSNVGYLAFDGNFNNIASRWRSPDIYNSSSPSTYEGTFQLPNSSASAGEYLILTIPKRIQLKYVIMNSLHRHTPYEVEIHGKNTSDSEWTYIKNYTYDDPLGSTTNEHFTTTQPINSTNYYSEYAFVVVKTNGHRAASISELELHGTEYKVIEYPPSAMNANTTYIAGYGNFVASASSSAFSDIYRAFNYDLNDVGWHTDENVYNTDGSYNGTSNLGGYLGEWISLQIPYASRINGINIAPRKGNYTHRVPRSLVLLGSNDGTNWNYIYDWTDINQSSYASNTFATFSFPTTTDSYIHFALVTRQIFTTSSTQSVQFGELSFVLEL